MISVIVSGASFFSNNAKAHKKKLSLRDQIELMERPVFTREILEHKNNNKKLLKYTNVFEKIKNAEYEKSKQSQKRMKPKKHRNHTNIQQNNTVPNNTNYVENNSQDTNQNTNTSSATDNTYDQDTQSNSNNKEQNTYENVNNNSQQSTTSNSSAADEIAQAESTNSYSAVNGRYYGKYQLDQSYLHGDYSPENQEKVFQQYVNERYGSVDNALAFRKAHNWY